VTPRDQRRVSNFNMRVRLMRSSEAQKALTGASASLPAASVAAAPRK
jgi:type IV pilus assembly protein PilN